MDNQQALKSLQESCSDSVNGIITPTTFKMINIPIQKMYSLSSLRHIMCDFACFIQEYSDDNIPSIVLFEKYGIEVSELNFEQAIEAYINKKL